MCSGAKVNEQELTYIAPNVHTVVYYVFLGSSCKAPPYVNLSNVILERMLL